MARRGTRLPEQHISDLIPPPPKDARLDAMLAVASSIKGWRPANVVLKRVQAVQTIFPQFDRGVRVGGLPIARISTIHGPSNEGKAQPLSAKILTPTGWTTMGEIHVGDLVIGADGKAHRVSGVYPQGEKEVFKVTMNDGATTRSCGEHLWYTTTINGGGSVKSLFEIIDTLKDDEHVIPTIKSVSFELMRHLTKSEQDDLLKYLVDERARREIVSVEPDGVAECQCIMVDAEDHLYVTDDFIITHNTVYSVGLMLSFLQRYHFVAHLDAEMTTPITWCEKLMGSYANHPAYLASRPTSYESAVDDVRRFLNAVSEAKAKGIVPQDTSGLVIVDSLRKLVPQNLMKTLLKDGAGKAGIDGMRGRGAQVRAALNSQWMDELVPLLHESNCAALLVTREAVDPEADAHARKYGWKNATKINGGAAVVYDASIVARIDRDRYIYQGSEEMKNVIGERHCVEIWKTKVAGKEDKTVNTFFHTSNGKLILEGFDRARDVLDLAKEMEIVKGEGHYSWNGQKWHGDNQAVQKLTAAPEMLAELEQQVRGGFVVEDPAPVVEEEEVKVAPPIRKRRGQK